jgi:hypothetical protein
MGQPIIDEAGENVLNLKLTNHLTGEITERTIHDADSAKNLLLDLNASAVVIKNAQERLKGFLDVFLGEDEEYRFVDGKLLRRVQRETVEWQTEELRKVLDEDQLEVCMKVDKTTARTLIKELMEDGKLPGDTIKKLDATADRKASKPFLEIR